jgi:hypothetical protein
MMTGCDNSYFHLPRQAASDTSLVFIAPGDGNFAWMNLDGRNVKLKLLKTTLYHLDEYGAANAVYEYRYQNVAVTVSLPFFPMAPSRCGSSK